MRAWCTLLLLLCCGCISGSVSRQATRVRSAEQATALFTTHETVVSDKAWTDVVNATCDVAGGAVAHMDALSRSRTLVAQGFGFLVPAAAVVTSVHVNMSTRIIEPRPDATSVREFEVSLVTRDNATGQDVFWPTYVSVDAPGWKHNGSTISYPLVGNDTLWGSAVASGADVSNAQFGVGIRVRNTNVFYVPAVVECISVVITFDDDTQAGSTGAQVATTGAVVTTGSLQPPIVPPASTTTARIPNTTVAVGDATSTVTGTSEGLATEIVYISVVGSTLLLIAVSCGGWAFARFRKQHVHTERVFNSEQANESGSISGESDLDGDAELDGVILGETIGKGHFGTVLRGAWMHTEVACKQIDDDTGAEAIAAEARVLQQLQHPNIVRMFGIFYSNLKRTTYIVMEYAALGALDSYVRKHRKTMHETKRRVLLSDIARGMMYVSSRGLVHGDLAARNVLLFRTPGGGTSAKVADFGLSVACDRITETVNADTQPQQYHRLPTEHRTAIPIKYSAPEVLEEARFSSDSDAWSFGIVMWEVYSGGEKPFARMPATDVVKFVIKGGLRLQCPDTCSSPVYNLMCLCWSIRPEHRPSFATIYDELDVQPSDTGNTSSSDNIWVSSGSSGIDDDYQT